MKQSKLTLRSDPKAATPAPTPRGKPPKIPPLAALIRQHSAPLLLAAAASARAVKVPKLVPWVRLDTEIPQQEQTQWCWAATSLGTHQYYQRTDTTTQCQAVNLILGVANACTSPTDAAINQPWFLDQALSAFGNLRAPIVSGTLNFTGLRAEIDGGTPLGTRIGWSGGGGHFMVIEGYRNTITKMLTIHDPIFGQSDMTYTAYATNYQGSGTWTHSYQTKSHRLRVLDGRTVAGGTVAAVSRKAHLLDLFMVDTQGRVVSAASDALWDRGRWRGWWHLQGGMARPGARVACVARQPDLLDIFVVGTDGGVYSAAWDPTQANGQWRGWWRIGNLSVGQGARLTAVSRHPDKLDIFVVDAAGRVMSAAWQRGDTQWRGWWHINSGTAPPGATVGAVARDSNKLDIFVTAADGAIRTAAWDANQANGQWRGWWPVQGGKAAPGAPVTAVARAPSKLDVFVVGTDKRVYTAAWDAAVANAAWRGWWPVAGGMAEHGSSVPCCARSANQLDIAVVGLDGGLYTAAWDQAVAKAKWRGWWRIGEGTSAQGGEVALLRRNPTSLDGFCVGADGCVYTVAWDAALARGHWRG